MRDEANTCNDNAFGDVESESIFRIRMVEREKFLLGAYNEQSLAFDKTLTTLASAMFAFSFGYVQFLGDGPVASTCLLPAIWGILGICLFSVLTSFLASQRACLRQIHAIDELLTNPSDYDDQDDRGDANEKTSLWSTLTRSLNWISYLSFVIAIAVFSVFVFSNLSSQEVRNAETDTARWNGSAELGGEEEEEEEGNRSSETAEQATKEEVGH